MSLDARHFAKITVVGTLTNHGVPTASTIGCDDPKCREATGEIVLEDGSLDEMYRAGVATVWLSGEEFAVGEPWPCARCIPVSAVVQQQV